MQVNDLLQLVVGVTAPSGKIGRGKKLKLVRSYELIIETIFSSNQEQVNEVVGNKIIKKRNKKEALTKSKQKLLQMIILTH